MLESPDMVALTSRSSERSCILLILEIFREKLSDFWPCLCCMSWMVGLTTFLLEATMRPPIIKMQCSFYWNWRLWNYLKCYITSAFGVYHTLYKLPYSPWRCQMQYIVKRNDETGVTFRYEYPEAYGDGHFKHGCQPSHTDLLPSNTTILRLTLLVPLVLMIYTVLDPAENTTSNISSVLPWIHCCHGDVFIVPLTSNVPWLSGNMSQYCWIDQINDKMGRICSIHVKEDKRVQNFGRKT